MANILDVAKAAGVSKSTVSRVLNNNGYVAEDTRIKIEEAMRKLNYKPSAFAQNIRTRKTRTLAMMIPDATNTFFMEIFKVIEEVALANNYLVVLSETGLNAEHEIYYAQNLLEHNIDGLIYFTNRRTPENTRYFMGLSQKIPVIFMDYAFFDVEGINMAACESREATKEAALYLLDCGCVNIGYIDLPGERSIADVRCAGYKDALVSRGLDPERLVVHPRSIGRTAARTGFETAEVLLKRESRLDAVMAASDQMAAGAVKYFNSVGARIPEQISVIGFDDINICEIISPMLSTIRQPIREMGIKAAEQLIALISGAASEPAKFIYPGKLILRGTTAEG